VGLCGRVVAPSLPWSPPSLSDDSASAAPSCAWPWSPAAPPPLLLVAVRIARKGWMVPVVDSVTASVISSLAEPLLLPASLLTGCIRGANKHTNTRLDQSLCVVTGRCYGW
jgi:hypothetical protein